MSRRFALTGWTTSVLTVTACMFGCGALRPVPETFDVALSANDSVTMEAGTGPAALAGGVWSLVRKADPADGESSEQTSSPTGGSYSGLLRGESLERPPVGERIFLAHCNDLGAITKITENRYLLAEYYGATIPVGADWRPTGLPGVSYRSNSYGVQADDRFGLAVVVHVRFGLLFLGQAVLYSWGTVTEDRIEGIFGYTLDFSDGVARALGVITDRYPVEGERIATMHSPD